MFSATNSPDAVDSMDAKIQEMYEDIMAKRFAMVELRKKGHKGEALKESEIELADLQHDFDSIVKTHNAFLKHLKVSGKDNKTNFGAILSKISQIESNTGKIVAEVPKN